MAKTASSKKSITFELGYKECKCLLFSFTEQAQKNKNEIPFTGFQFDFKAEFRLEPNERLINYLFYVDLFDITSGSRILISQMKTSHVFFLENFENVVKKVENRLLIPDQLIVLMSGFAVGAARGMFAIKLENTVYSNALIPLVDPDLFHPKANLWARKTE